MKCENCFCIYEQKGLCTLNEISLDVSGSCNDCIYVSVNRILLEKEKQITLTKFDYLDNG